MPSSETRIQTRAVLLAMHRRWFRVDFQRALGLATTLCQRALHVDIDECISISQTADWLAAIREQGISVKLLNAMWRIDSRVISHAMSQSLDTFQASPSAELAEKRCSAWLSLRQHRSFILAGFAFPDAFYSSSVRNVLLIAVNPWLITLSPAAFRTHLACSTRRYVLLCSIANKCSCVYIAVYASRSVLIYDSIVKKDWLKISPSLICFRTHKKLWIVLHVAFIVRQLHKRPWQRCLSCCRNSVEWALPPLKLTAAIELLLSQSFRKTQTAWILFPTPMKRPLLVIRLAIW